MLFKKYQCVKQLDEKDCGAACIATILRHYGSRMSLSKIRDIAGTNQEGTSALGIVRAAEKLGFSAKGVRGDHTVLDQPFGLPAIAHVILDGNLMHYVVIHKIKKNEIIIADPGRGLVRYTKEDFLNIWTGVLLLMLPAENYKEYNERSTVKQDIFRLIIHQKSLIVHTILTSLIITILGITGAFYFQYIIDDILPNNSGGTLHIVSIGMLIMFLFKVILTAFRQYLMIILGQKLSISIMLGYFKHVVKLPMKFFNTRKIGEIISRFNDATKVIDAIASISISVFLDTFMLLLAGVFLFLQNTTLFFVVLAIVPVYIFVVLSFVKPYHKINGEEMENNAQLTSTIVDYLEGMETIKAHNAEYKVATDTEKKLVKYLRSAYKHGVLDNFQNSIKVFIDLTSGIVILWIGSIQVMKGNLSIGQLIAFNALLVYFFDPLQSLLSLQSKLQSATVASKRLEEVLEIEPELTITENARTKITNTELIKGPVQFNKVSFQYDLKRKILNEVTLNIKSGEKVAFVGESGSGKSTLAKLLMNFYKVESGDILINENNLKDISITALRETISYIPQEPYFFNGTIIENLLLGSSKSYTFEEVITICKLTMIHDFINDLPFRYETVIEENGSNLSGGQKQRLAIARALLRKPSILIMDESTSNLDSLSELEISKVINNLSKDITAIIIAHRLSLVKNCDKIFVIENGEVLEQGSHEELIHLKGKYFNLWDNQTSPEKLVTH
ncbi:peptide cleavage/export ABC transporter [Bacillus spizizenii]|uniref:Peptide cleavage/export ABC transporter n=1 Tax=Bacillus spizizenii TaxID=96241 RepID=A0A9Q4E246_BACSC|nr:peptide cleavage/export ABC transporter [Bacillus spizizenii]MCY8455291.1 peptide cleavage/export ABC transporter [Bacillus spizizenii]